MTGRELCEQLLENVELSSTECGPAVLLDIVAESSGEFLIEESVRIGEGPTQCRSGQLPYEGLSRTAHSNDKHGWSYILVGRSVICSLAKLDAHNPKTNLQPS
jgi:hypothetical protein